MKACILSAVIYLVLVACHTSYAKGGIGLGKILTRIFKGRGRSGSYSSGSSSFRWSTNSQSRFRSSSNRDYSFSPFRSRVRSASGWGTHSNDRQLSSYFDRSSESSQHLVWEFKGKSHNLPILERKAFDGNSNFAHTERILHKQIGPKSYPQPYGRYVSDSNHPPPYEARQNPPPYSAALNARHGPQQTILIRHQPKQSFRSAHPIIEANSLSSRSQQNPQNNAGLFEMYHHPYLVPVNRSRSLNVQPQKKSAPGYIAPRSGGLVAAGIGWATSGKVMETDILNSEDCEISSIIGKYSNRIRWDCLRTKNSTTCQITCSNDKGHFPDEPKMSREYVCSRNGNWTPKIIPPCVFA